MIPKICANCAKGSNVGNDEEILGTICFAMPFQLWKRMDDVCLGFEMAEQPAVVLPDEMEAEKGVSDGE